MYWSGLFTGVTASSIAVLVWMGAQLGGFRAMYASFGAPIPQVTEVVIHPGFQWGAPAAVLLALVAANLRRDKPVVLLGVLAALAVAAVVVGYWGSHLPLNQLAGGIR